MLLPILMNLGFAAGTVVAPPQPQPGFMGNIGRRIEIRPKIKLPESESKTVSFDKIIKEDDELLLLIRAFLKTQP